ncbi:MAG: hypothetical protein NXY57DRAFT_1042571 [Lentinula lateritia]|uniref:Uncharacterized protein n=1 Tax=Lentinula lateritia TaxID=40482 RepID=A0ABQ8V6Z1_9AGAR|nr:MAG: hypothetical protein NXY57DRAFT_1042571 [Lentinula lateritia]KAJ4477595.1 hypothetical protein C8R41DRAFT_869534 [Lentinula lateritia]
MTNEIGDFQDLQAKTNLIVSGSVALNFFTYNTYNDNLDPFCHLNECLTVGAWYISRKYAYRPVPPQLSSFKDEVLRVQEIVRRYSEHPTSNGLHGDVDISSTVQIWTFHNGTSTIQLFASSCSPLEILLLFHSTCVMNVLTHRAAYCFFPHLTLIENCSLLNSVNLPFSDRQLLSLVKYGQRGFYFMNMPSVFRTIDRKSALSFFFPRSPGDRHSYKLKFIHVGSAHDSNITIEMAILSSEFSISTQVVRLLFVVQKGEGVLIVMPALWLWMESFKDSKIYFKVDVSQ